MLIDCPGVLCKTYYRFSPHLSTYPSLNVCDFLCNCFSFPHSCGWKGSWSPSENGTECFGCEFWAHLPTISALLNCQQAAQHRLGLRFPPPTHTHTRLGALPQSLASTALAPVFICAVPSWPFMPEASTSVLLNLPDAATLRYSSSATPTMKSFHCCYRTVILLRLWIII